MHPASANWSSHQPRLATLPGRCALNDCKNKILPFDTLTSSRIAVGKSPVGTCPRFSHMYTRSNSLLATGSARTLASCRIPLCNNSGHGDPSSVTAENSTPLDSPLGNGCSCNQRSRTPLLVPTCKIVEGLPLAVSNNAPEYEKRSRNKRMCVSPSTSLSP
eukprot:1918094-Rhodomonas_salina.2